ncbi:tetratricopeptide repeat protein [candidate division TA06 bacterium]|nr:tetratricopeptide repeat protein [candidate division TA06 bacterium]
MKKNKHRSQKTEKISVVPAGSYLSIFLDGLKPYIWLLLAVALVYGQTIRFGFVGYDDVSLVSRQAGQALDLGRIKAAFSESAFGSGPGLFFYRPLLAVSILFDSFLAGNKHWIYHLNNLLFHIAAVWLAFGLFVILKYIRPAAFAAAMILAVHPVLASAVSWLPGRNDSMLAVWVLAAMMFHLRFLETKRIINLAAQGVCFLAALFTKETALAFPGAALGAIFLLTDNGVEKSRKVILSVLTWLAAILLWYLARSSAMAMYDPAPLSFLLPREVLITLVSVFGRIGLPFDLTLVRDLKDINLVYGLISLAALIAAAVIGGIRNKRTFTFGVIWFGLFLLPGLFLAGDTNAFLDHRLYLPLIGFLILLLELKILDLPAGGKKREIGCFFLALLLGALSFAYSRSFKDDLSCWTRAVKKSPNSALAHNALGLVYSQRNNPQAAEKEYLKARQISPKFVKAGLNLGILYLKNGRPESAGQVLQEVLAVRPDLPGANYNLGVAYQQKGQEDSALYHYQQELENDPRNEGALAGTGTIYHQRGDLGQALCYYRKALEIKGDDPGVLVNLASVYQQQGNLPEAERTYLRAIGVNPGSAEAHYNLGRLYQKQDRRQEAEIELNKAFSLRPSLKSKTNK